MLTYKEEIQRWTDTKWNTCLFVVHAGFEIDAEAAITRFS